MANYISLIDIANQLNKSKETIIKRFASVHIEPLDLNHKLWYLKSDVALIKEMKITYVHSTLKERFSILEYFL